MIDYIPLPASNRNLDNFFFFFLKQKFHLVVIIFLCLQVTETRTLLFSAKIHSVAIDHIPLPASNRNLDMIFL